MSTTLKDWNLALEAITHGRLDHNYIQENLTSLLSSTDLPFHIDDLGESLLYYSLVYQNSPLLHFILDKADFSSFPDKAKDELTKSVFRAINYLTYQWEKNAQFVKEGIARMAATSFAPMLSELIEQGYLSYVLESLVSRKIKAGDLVAKIQELVKEHSLIPEDSPRLAEIKKIRKCMYNKTLNSIDENDRKRVFNNNFHHFECEFYHNAIEKGLFNHIEALNLVSHIELLLQKNLSGESAFLLLFKKAPAELLMKYLKTFCQVIENPEKIKEQTNKRNQTFLHLLILNKLISLEEKIDIIQKIHSNCNLQEYCMIPDNQDMIPLVSFIYQFGKEIQQNYTNFLKIFEILAPKINKIGSDASQNLVKLQSSVLIQQFTRRDLRVFDKSLEDFLREDFVYHQKIIKACLDCKLENLLLHFLQKLSYLNLNSIYLENFVAAKHFICIAAENNCKEILKWFLKEKSEREPSLLPLKGEEVFMNGADCGHCNFMLTTEQIIDYSHYSIFDSIIDSINSDSSHTIEQDTKELLMGIFERMWKSLSLNQRNQALLNITLKYKNRPFNSFGTERKWPQFLITKLYMSGDSRLLHLIQEDILNLRNQQLPNQIRKGLLFSTVECKAIDLIDEHYITSCLSTSELFEENELFELFRLLCRVPKAFSKIFVDEEIKKLLCKTDWFCNLNIGDKEEKVVQNVAPLLASLFANDGSIKDKQSSLKLLFGRVFGRTTLKLVKEIYRIVIQEKKVKDVVANLDIGQNNVPQAKKFFKLCCKTYMSSTEDDKEFENQLMQMNYDSYCLILVYSCSNSWIGGELKFSVVLTHLQMLKKASRFNLKDSKIKLGRVFRKLEEIKKLNIKSPEILYFPFFLSLYSDSYIHEYAIDICKQGGKDIEIVKEVYGQLPFNGYRFQREAVLLEHAIRKGDVKGVESVIDCGVYSTETLNLCKSPFLGLVTLLRSRPGTNTEEEKKVVNQIFNKFWKSYPLELVGSLLLQKTYFRESRKYKRSVNYICLLCERNFMEIMDEENSRLIFEHIVIPSQTDTEKQMIGSQEGQFLSTAEFFTKALYERNLGFIKTFAPQIVYENGWDVVLLRNAVRNLSREKLPKAFEVLKSREHVSRELYATYLKFCLKYEKDSVEPIVRVICQKKERVTDVTVLEELRAQNLKCYYILMLSNNISEHILTRISPIIQKILVQINPDDLVSTIKMFKENRKKDLASLFNDQDFARVLGLNGLHAKLDTLIEVGNELVQDALLKKQELIEWAYAGLKASCEAQEILAADKITTFNGKSQFNMFDLRHVFKVKEKNGATLASEKRVPIPNYYLFGHESLVAKDYNSKVKKWGVRIGPLRERELMTTDQLVPFLSQNKSKPAVEEPKDTGVQSKAAAARLRARGKANEKKEEIYEKNPPTPIPARTVFGPCEKYWGLYNENDDHNQGLVISKMLGFLHTSALENGGESVKILEEALLAGVRADILAVEKELTKYLDSLHDEKVFEEFYLKTLASFFESRNAFIVYKRISRARVHKVYEHEYDSILGLLKYLEKFNRTHPREEKDSTRDLFLKILQEIYSYGDLNIAQKLCEFIVKEFKDASMVCNFGFDKATVLGIFIKLSIDKKSLSHFLSLLTLDNSLEEACRPDRPTEKSNILAALFTYNLPNFIAEYDKLKGNSQLLKPLDSIPYNHSLIRVSHPSLLHLAIVKGFSGLLKTYASKARFSEEDIECALASKNFDIFEIVLNKVFNDDKQRIFAYIKDHKILLRTVKELGEGAVLRLVKGYVFEKSQAHLAAHWGQVLDEEYFKARDDVGWTIFHYVAFNQMSQVFYLLLEYIKKVLCYDNMKNFVTLMGDILNQTGLPDTGSSAKNVLSPLQFALKVRFYEAICFANQFGIPKIDMNTKKFVLTSEVKCRLSGDELTKKLEIILKDQNEFNSLYIEAIRALQQSIELVKNSNLFSIGSFPKSGLDVLEQLYLINCSSGENDQSSMLQGIDNEAFSVLKLDTVLIRLYPEMVPAFLSASKISNMSPLVMLYYIEKTYGTNSNVENEYLKNIYQTYMHEVQNVQTSNDKQSSKKKMEQLWLDKDLDSTIQKIRTLLNIEKKEAKVTDSLRELCIPDEAIWDLAHQYSIQKNLFVLKALVLNYPYLFFVINEGSAEASNTTATSFWYHLTDDPSFMCDVLSATDAKTFENYIASNFEILMGKFAGAGEDNYDPSFKTNSLVWCVFYIAFSLRAEQDNKLLSQEYLPELIRRIINPLVDPKSKNSQLSTVCILLGSFLNFISSNTLTYKRTFNFESQKPLLTECCVELRKIFKPLVVKASGKQYVEITEEDIDKQFETCVNFVLKTSNTDNPLIVYTSALLTCLSLLDVVERVTAWGERFKVSIKLSFVDSLMDPQAIGVKVSQPNPPGLELVIAYSIHYEEAQKLFVIDWETRSEYDVEQDIGDLVAKNKKTTKKK